jgi:hypothetical protein
MWLKKIMNHENTAGTKKNDPNRILAVKLESPTFRLRSKLHSKDTL